ncbi:uncharacterized protein FSUBG_544 [Fusarium subglutinans]|uniref:Uncharacterized protein n=1 Tax=Gibberella subglutinans TaxID=42677 RepID=A0A8H5QER4_GIBSU|nr:uncharacterized protein FSUBG_544 [Fusarium subglutinans]KAF5613932.1 hypothetical protein FSUBG_544 [Fusarium subglutinans]
MANTSAVALNSLSIYSKGLPAFAEQSTCANPYWPISSNLLPQMSSSARPPNEGNSEGIVQDEIQALVERIDDSIFEWHSDDGSNHTIDTEEVIYVPNAPDILAGENTEVNALFSGTQPTTPCSKEMDGLAFHLLRVRDSFTAISYCLRNMMWTIDRNNNVEESDSSSYTSGESFESNGTGGGPYQQTGQDGVNPLTESRYIILIKAMLIDERHLPLAWPH